MRIMMAYIDPGTGAMLFSVLIGLISAGFFFAKKLIIKLKFMMSGGSVKAGELSRLPYVIFSDHKRYWNVFKPICDEFEKRGIDCEFWTASPDDPALDEKYEHVKCLFIGEGNKAFAKLNMMNADICLATTPGLDVYQWKRSKEVKYYVHIVHEVGEVLTYRMFGTDYFDAVLLTGEFQKDGIRKLEELRNLDKKDLVVVGSTYMDVMEKKAEALEKKSNDEINVLAAPSWGESSILNRFGEKFLQALVDTGYNVIVRPHPQSFTSEKELIESLQKKFPDGDKFSWNRDNDNFAVLNKADVMISDFSGVVFDYTLIFDRSILYADTKLDLAPYDACWIDEPIWRQSVLPMLGEKLVEEDFPRMKEIIDELLSNEKYGKNRGEVRDTCWQNRGNAAVSVVDYLVNKHEELCSE